MLDSKCNKSDMCWRGNSLPTYSMGIETAQLKGKTIDFLVHAVGEHLRTPIDGLMLEDLSRLSKKQHEDMFEGDFPWEG